MSLERSFCFILGFMITLITFVVSKAVQMFIRFIIVYIIHVSLKCFNFKTVVNSPTFSNNYLVLLLYIAIVFRFRLHEICDSCIFLYSFWNFLFFYSLKLQYVNLLEFFLYRWISTGVPNDFFDYLFLWFCVFLLSQWQQKSFLAAKTCCENAVFLTSFAAIEIAGKLLGIWGRFWGPPKTAYTGLQKDTLTSLISPMVWLHDPCKEKCLYCFRTE